MEKRDTFITNDAPYESTLIYANRKLHLYRYVSSSVFIVSAHSPETVRSIASVTIDKARPIRISN